MEVFIPSLTAVLSASSSSSRVALETGDDRVVACNNTLTEVVFIKFGSSAVVATTSPSGYDMPLPASALIRIRVPDGATHVAGITGSGSGTVYFTVGAGG